MNSLPIGIFDSGVGGLTVLRAVWERVPCEDVVYLGDTARVPYGTKSQTTIERYAVEDAGFLIEKGVKLIVIACNTASALAAPALRERFSLPILGVIGPGGRAAARATRNGRIGVIGTEATIASGAYEQRIREAWALQSTRQPVEIFSRACPLFVPLAEEGETDSLITRTVAEKYLASLRSAHIDTLVLGCTHYPLLKKVIAETMGSEVTLVDSAEAVAQEVADLLTEKHLANDSSRKGAGRFFVTDAAQRFHRIAERFLGMPLEHLEAVEVWGHDRLHTH